ncbi:hypothetical protein D3C78_1428950 [compost metagenome]
MGEGELGLVHVVDGVAHQVLGLAGALAALGADTRGLAHLAIAAAALVDGIANLVVGHTQAKTDVHGATRKQSVDASILVLMRSIVKHEQ